MATVVDRWTAEPDKRNGKRWDVRWRDEQHRSRRKAFKLRADAERFKTDIEHALSRGTYRDPRDGERPFAASTSAREPARASHSIHSERV